MPTSGKPQGKSERPRIAVSLTLSGVVERIVETGEADPIKAQIAVEGADDMYREIRVPNVFRDGNGGTVALEEGSEVEITITLTKQTS